MMLSFCNQSTVHPFLGSLPNSNNNGTLLDFSIPHHHHQNIFTAAAKRDPGGIGFLDEVGGSVNGLMSCTESLGFESCEERIADDQIDQDYYYSYDHDQKDNLISKRLCNSSLVSSNSRWQRSNLEKKEKKKFPPPLSSLNQDGKPAFFLRAVRTDGRLELKEVKIGRPETLRASRQDGRLRLHLIRDEYDQEEIQQEEDDVESEEAEEEENIDKNEEVIEAIDENDHEEIVNDDDDNDVSEWKLPVTRPRCYELPITHHHRVHVHGHVHQHHGHVHVHGHGPHDLHVWRQHCVTTT